MTTSLVELINAEALAQRVERLEERNAHNARRAEGLVAELNEAPDEQVIRLPACRADK